MNLFRSGVVFLFVLTVSIMASVSSEAGTNKPAIDLNNYGVVSWLSSGTPGTDIYIKVIDHDGISSDGSSHAVSVKLPDNSVYTLGSEGSNDSVSHFYSGYGSVPVQTGDYTFMVTDGDGNTVEMKDSMDAAYSLGIPDENTFLPAMGSTVSDTTPTFSWATVTGALHYRVRVYSTYGSKVWDGYTGTNSYNMPSGILSPNTAYKYRIYARGNHQGLEIDHTSLAPFSSEDYILFTTGSQDNAPSIDFDSSGAQTYSDGLQGTYFSFWVKIFDAQGSPDDIKEVTVTSPTAETFPLYFNYQEASNCAVFSLSAHGNIQSGNYTFTVVDKSGNTTSMIEYLDANPIGYPPAESITGILSGSTGTALAVDWDDVPGAAFYRLEIYDKDLKRIYAFPTTTSEYSVPEGFFKPGNLYRYSVKTRREFFSQNIDNLSVSHGLDIMWPAVVPGPVPGSNAPLIDIDNSGVAVWRVPDSDPLTANPSFFGLVFEVKVTDYDQLPANDVRVSVTYPDGVTIKVLQPEYYIDTVSAYYFGFESYADSASIQSGVYTFSAIDTDGNSVSVTDAVSVNTVDLPVNVTPAKNSIVNGVKPKIKWDAVSGASKYRVRIYSGYSTIHDAYITDNFYIVPEGVLELNKMYNYRVYAYRESYPENEMDSYSSTPVMSGDRPYFITRPLVQTWMNLLLN